MTLKRYADLSHDGCMEETADGEFVRFEDAQARIAALEAEVEQWKSGALGEHALSAQLAAGAETVGRRLAELEAESATLRAAAMKLPEAPPAGFEEMLSPLLYDRLYSDHSAKAVWEWLRKNL